MERGKGTPRRRLLIGAALTLTVAVVAVLVFVLTAGPATAEQFATLHPLGGTVEVQGSGASGFRPGTEGQTLRQGDTVRTGPDGRASIEYFDGSETRLDYDTEFRLTELASIQDRPGSKVISGEQEEGKTFHRVTAITDSESRFDTETPTATASVQGTSYVVHSLPSGFVVVWVIPDEDPEESSVLVTLADGTEITLVEGQGLVIYPSGVAGDPFPLEDSQIMDPWVLFNLCQVDELDLPQCEEEEEETDGDGDGEKKKEPEPTPQPPPTPPTFTVTEPDTFDGDGGGGGTRGPDRHGDGDRNPPPPPEDTTPPESRITAHPDDPTNDPDATFRFTSNEEGSTFEYRLDAGGWKDCRSPKTYRNLDDGSHTFGVRATDPSGNTEHTSEYSWLIDTNPPQTEITDEDGCTKGCPETITYEYRSDEPRSSFTCHLVGQPGDRRGPSGTGGTDERGPEPCGEGRTGSISYSGLQDFYTYEFEVWATDHVDNRDRTPASDTFFYCCSGSVEAPRNRDPVSRDLQRGLGFNFARYATLDLVAPDVLITSGPRAEDASDTASFIFHASEPGSTFECSLDASPFEPCASPAEYAGLLLGSHQFEVRATDETGNTGKATRWTWTAGPAEAGSTDDSQDEAAPPAGPPDGGQADAPPDPSGEPPSPGPTPVPTEEPAPVPQPEPEPSPEPSPEPTPPPTEDPPVPLPDLEPAPVLE
jgi:hypothetical protein